MSEIQQAAFDRQVAFTKALLGVRGQNCLSIDEDRLNGCAYTVRRDVHCNIGWLFPEGYDTAKIEGWSLRNGGADTYPYPEMALVEIFPCITEADLDFLAEMQKAHDSIIAVDFSKGAALSTRLSPEKEMELYEKNMRKFAAKFKLHFTEKEIVS